VITHNLGLVTRYAERVYVMYAGRVVESGTTEQLLMAPAHPYTVGLLNSIPKLEGSVDEELKPIEGAPLDLANLPEGCAFASRCPRAMAVCTQGAAPTMRAAHAHQVACHLFEPAPATPADTDDHSAPQGAALLDRFAREDHP
jgi:oligopeptide/dipeptide ABC transporter ATP-binding protein